MIKRWGPLALAWVCLGVAPALAQTEQEGALTFPDDESAQPVSWDYWWGAARITTTSGNHYVVGGAYTSNDDATAAGYEIFPLQGPYQHQAVMSVDGPENWGSPAQPASRFVYDWTKAIPGTHPLLRLDTLDTMATPALKRIDRWTRDSLSNHVYSWTVDQDDATVSPAGSKVHMQIDLRADMADPPLLAGGTGRWFYNVPEDFGYPSRGYQYMLTAKRLTGSLAVTQPDGSTLRETIDPKRSSMMMIRESDPVEDIPAGLGLAAATQLNARYPTYYNLQWPWELVFADLGNGAQLMFDLQGYHDTPDGLLRPLTPNMPTYRVLATLRLPNGKSVPMNSELHAEHLDTRELSDDAHSFSASLNSPVVQAWKYRLSYRGGVIDGVRVPAFDIGLSPPWPKSDPLPNAKGDRLIQRVPFNVTGWYAGCPVDGFAWSEDFVNWYGYENRDPWRSDDGLPVTPGHCTKVSALPAPPSGPGGNLNPAATNNGPPNPNWEGCMVSNPGTATCTYKATQAGSIGGDGATPGAWSVTINRPGRPDPLVIRSDGGFESYVCGTIRAGDKVTATVTQPDSGVDAGDSGLCI